MKSPAVLFYTGDFLTGCTFMSNDQIGAYIKLLCLQHQLGHLEENYVFSITRDDIVLSKFIRDRNGKYYNKRMHEEIDKRANYSKSRSANRLKTDNTTTCIYLIKNNDNGLTKIGCSNKPERRIIELKNQLKTDNLQLLAYVKNVSQKIERKIQKQYAEQVNYNEWFNLTNQDIEDIITDNHMIKHMIHHMENENEDVNISDSNINIYTLYEQNFNRTISPLEYEKLKSWNNEGLVKYAIEEAVMNNAKNIKYVEAILLNLKNDGITTYDQAKSRTKKKKETKVPDWFDKTFEKEKVTYTEEEMRLRNEIIGND